MTFQSPLMETISPKTGRWVDYLFNKRNADESIILQDALFYEPLSTYYPEDVFYTLTKKQSFDTLSKNVGVNTVVDLRLYTDALGALGKEPNGIVLTDVRLKQILHRLHYPHAAVRQSSIQIAFLIFALFNRKNKI